MIRINRIHPFPARMAPSIVANILSELEEGRTVLDPMSGSGTTLAAAAKFGHRVIGFDTDPLAVLLSGSIRLKFRTCDVLECAETIASRARSALRDISPSNAYPEGADSETKSFIRYWFCETSRRQLAALCREINTLKPNAYRQIAWIALSRMIIKKDKGVSLAMDVSHSRPHRKYCVCPVKPLDHFIGEVNKVACAIDELDFPSGIKFSIRKGDARKLPLEAGIVDVIITSPPYLNAIDYMRGHRLSLVWMGHQLSELRQIRTSNIGAEIGMHASSDEVTLANFGQIHLLPQRYANILRRYAIDMQLVLQELYRVLKPTGRAYLVVGNSNVRGVFITNDEGIKHLAEKQGFYVMQQTRRAIPDNKRYLPPPSLSLESPFSQRMREEIVLELAK